MSMSMDAVSVLASAWPEDPWTRETPPRRRAAHLLAGVRAEFLDFRDRSHGPLDVDEIDDALAEERFVWIDIDCQKTRPEVAAELLPATILAGFDPSLVTDESCCETRGSSLRRSDRLLQITLVGVVDGTDGLVGQSLHLLIGEGFLVTFHRGPSAVLREVRRDYLGDFQRHAATPSFLIYELWNEQVDQYLRLQNRLEEKVERMRLKLRGDADESTLLELADVTGELLALRKRVMPTRRVLEEIVARKTTLISGATLGYMEGMIATLERLLSDITSNLAILESGMNFSLTVATHRTNLVMNRLAVVSTIFLPLTFLCGVYGMNFERIPELAWSHGYGFFWALSAMITGSLIVVLRRARLL
jgi:magnesium/cobalt transport protein CorA